MNNQNLFKEDSFRNFITISMPGYFGTWPLLIFILQTHNIHTDNIETILTIIWTIFAFGIGMILEDLGGRLELKLEILTKIDKDELQYYWRRYLLMSEKNDVYSSKMLKYISTLVTRLKYECSMAIALFMMIILISIIQLNAESIFIPNCTFVSIIIISIITACYLLWEATSSIEVLHLCRKRLVDFCDYPRSPKSISENFINPRFDNFKK